LALRWRADLIDEASHDWLVLVPEGHEYLNFVSDLGAFDPQKHQGSKETVIPPVINWPRLDRTPH